MAILSVSITLIIYNKKIFNCMFYYCTIAKPFYDFESVVTADFSNLPL